MQNQLVANFATSVVSDSLGPLDFMLTGEEARIRQARSNPSAILVAACGFLRHRLGPRLALITARRDRGISPIPA
jgi:hypothetical protein